MSGSTGLTAEVLDYLARVKRFVDSGEIFQGCKQAGDRTQVSVVLNTLYADGKNPRLQRIKAPAGMRVQYLFAALGVAVQQGSQPKSATPDKPAALPVPEPGPALRIPVKPITEAQKKFRVGRFSDGTMLIENLPGGGNLELDKESADQLLQLVRG